MRNEQSMLEVLDAIGKRREERRNFLRVAGASAAAVGGLSLLAACGDDNNNNNGGGTSTPTPTPSNTAITDNDILNFALQLEYLEANFYSYAVFGTAISSTLTGGVGTQGTVATSTTGTPRAVSFTGEPTIGQYAREIAADEIAHVAFLRTVLGNAAAAQPAINLSGDANGAFTVAARAAGIATSNGTLTGTPSQTGTFDPYSSPDAFLLGAFIFEDVGVTAYKGAAPLLSSKAYLEASAGILAAEAYHAGLIRTVLYNRGQSTTGLIAATTGISDARDGLDGAPADNALIGVGADDDQGLTSPLAAGGTTANLVPTNSNALAYSRTTSQVLHIAYLSGTAGVSAGGFFPAGVNGSIRIAA